MARFTVRKSRFGRKEDAEEDDDGEGLPTPTTIKLAARRAAGIAEAKEVLERLPGPGESLHAVCTARLDLSDVPTPTTIKLAARRAAGIAEAKEVLERLPGPGESLHAVCTARLDLSDVLNALLERLGRCERMLIATLGYNDRNLAAMLRWLDAGSVASLTLMASIFFRSHKGALWTETLTEFRRRGQRAACCHSHAKVATLAFASGETLCIEGSANLCGNGSGREQFALINDAALTAWHSQWIEALATKHEPDNET